MSKHNAGHLNAICPYFTMFPLEFPYSILKHRAQRGQWVLDPFCGRGTTNYASRLLALPSIGIDSSPVAVALSEAKIANVTPQQVVDEAVRILEEVPVPAEVPDNEFWRLAYDRAVLETLCRLREGLLANRQTEARKALCAVILGALHGPQGKTKQTYFSNQSQRTYAPKPAYAVRFWKERKLHPRPVDVLEIIEMRAKRYYGREKTSAEGVIVHGDSREQELFLSLAQRIDWVITSPPYYGLRTYLPDQWLRLWLLGGKPEVTYTNENQLQHGSVEQFVEQLRRVWRNVASISNPGARMVIRFGAINDRNVDPIPLFKESLRETGWRISTITSAGTAANGRRQALHMIASQKAKQEYDLWAVLAA